MRIYHFSEEPYPDAWGAERPSLRITLPNEICDPDVAHRLYNRYIDEWMLADELGFDIMLNEHHSTATCLTASASIILSILARVTKRARLLVLGVPIGNRPDPIRVAEEMSMIDVISKGRLEFGMIKGVPYDIEPANSNAVSLMPRFWEAHDLIVKAMTTTTGPFSFEGDYFHYRNINIWPRPYQQPRPPIWIPSQGSSETVKWAADPSRKYQFLVTFSSTELVTRYLTTYRAQCTEFGYECSGDQLGWAVPVYVADTDEKAKEEAGKAIETLFGDYLPNPWEMLLPPGQTLLSRIRPKIVPWLLWLWLGATPQ
jgi:alkanesulfonate monooxygenase SsuD/methylene tetrahydromethanopterin reductase-like flavin-dependent oxidoreductase (luciferase family)